MELIDRLAHAHAALAGARADEAQRIAEAKREHQIVGVLGEAEVGKTATVRQALRLSEADGNALYLDLDGAAGDGHAGFLLAKQIARTVLGETDFSLLSGGVLLPARVERGRLRLAELLGVEGLDEALREWPSGHYLSTSAFGALEKLVKQRDVTLWIDHVEAPHVTPRHPLNLDGLLWGVRELSQRERRLRVIVSGREALEDEILGPQAAFHQQGRWMSLDVPAPWVELAAKLGALRLLAKPLSNLTGGHPATMLLGLLHIKETRSPRLPHAEHVLRELAARDDGLAARAIQQARTLHRLGGQVLRQIALGQRPYAASQRGSASPQEIRKVLNRLRLAGLLRRSDGWAIVNPLVSIALRGTVNGPLNVEDYADR